MTMSSEDNVIETQVSIGVIKAGQIETNRRLSSIEKKMDNFTFVKTDDFAEFKKEVAEKYATKEEVKPMRTLFWSIITGLILGIIGVGFAMLQAKL